MDGQHGARAAEPLASLLAPPAPAPGEASLGGLLWLAMLTDATVYTLDGPEFGSGGGAANRSTAVVGPCRASKGPATYSAALSQPARLPHPRLPSLPRTPPHTIPPTISRPRRQPPPGDGGCKVHGPQFRSVSLGPGT